MKNIKLLKPQPSPKNRRSALANITNFFHSKEKPSHQTYRGPSLSPKNEKSASYFQAATCRKNIPKESFQRKNNKSFMPNSTLQAKEDRDKRTMTKKSDYPSSMMEEAFHYINTCKEVLQTVNRRLQECQLERDRSQNMFLRTKTQIEQKRIEMLSRINQQYDYEIQREEEKYVSLVKTLEEEERKLVDFQREFLVMKEDITQNVKDLEGKVQMSEFREIMDIYWSKISHFQVYNSSNTIKGLSESSQAFVTKYVPPAMQVKVVRSKTTMEDDRSKSNRQFTFNKQMWNLQRARGGYSWEEASPATDSRESIVEQRINLR